MNGSRLALLALVASLAACGEPATPLTYPGHEKLLADPARFDAEDYERLRLGAAGDSERLFVIALAAYLVRPGMEQSRAMAQAFPEQRVMSFVYLQLEEPRLTPSYLYSIGELGRMAVSGLEEAVNKLVATIPWAESPVRPLLCDTLREATTTHPRLALTAIDGVPLRDREPLYACFDGATPEQARRLSGSLRGAVGAAPFVESELRKRLPGPQERRS